MFVRRTDELGTLLPEGAQLIPPHTVETVSHRQDRKRKTLRQDL